LIETWVLEMKKSLILFFAIPVVGWSLPVGNPADPAIYANGVWIHPSDCCKSFWNDLSFRAGYYGDFVFNRHVTRTNDTGQIEQLQINTNAGLLTVNIAQRFDIFGTLGATHADAVSQSVHGDFRFDLEYDTNFSWSVGSRAVLWQWGKTTLGAEGQYFAYWPHIIRYTEIGLASGYPDDYAHARFYEWQVGVGLSHRICNFIPYAAIKWSYMNINNENSTVLGILINNFESKKNVGYAIGVTWVDDDRATLAIEGRWADEKACYVNGQLRF
jgi:major outer membrane protein